ncbi:dTDP-4-dehydrorhamnose 3,5-epimerase [Paenibacillus alvei]|uniref:dTDP-4-dehydrorhamnose 3,5-epimerase n=1 Tax=Paenibacillus alvei TaxID=44250 RepID=A0ABT4GWC4_PAEAL|nr:MULTISPECIES: dTDP-4-dehydrorhamnose 3,5-epimerase [Paenibacillus]MCY7486351.1 dTDP-4-dehydrorhamnose 3,5-epimerase [Paenibacillus alvei]MCY9542250.1 dTDP-4-dehydrorhamnose 3,5-epimerase [Paenibacillus alvei]MCY9707313.1 dTDP-4-dehydrorhamnose 3,5-epimerase [Paenibacillus alvei]MCY9736226.1 dTDP-4-dehydrorhamnose 3,5-epimerase [Paenibacillus alvei]MCY9758268.1 dTDP-4-dehydrorhamnose 3,5-epimerase [Paenibacillus alvei]
MKVSQTALSEVLLIEPTVFEDERGFFMESYHADKWRQLGVDYSFVQDNHSLSVRAGTLRGLHYQLEPYAQTKLVRVVAGAIYDVAVDIRQGSPTFGQWVGVILSASNHRQLLIPQGFAHGFCTLVPNTEVLYKVDAPYHAASDRGIAWNDPAIHIAWPVNEPILSEKDGKHPLLNDAKLPSGLSALHARDKGGAAE